MTKRINYAELADDLSPFLIKFLKSNNSGAGGGVLTGHSLSGTSHSGTLANSQAPQFALLDGSRPFTGNIAFSGAGTVDGVDVGAFYATYLSHSHPSIYYTKSESDTRFVNVTGDTMTGQLTLAPGSALPPFILGANALGQLVAGLNSDLLDGYDSVAFPRKAEAATIAGAWTFNADVALGTSAQVNFFDEIADKLLLYSNTYGIGMESSTVTQWSAANHRWRIGGTSAATGTQKMILNATGLQIGASSGTAAQMLDVTGNALISGSATANTLVATTSLSTPLWERNSALAINSNVGDDTSEIDFNINGSTIARVSNFGISSNSYASGWAGNGYRIDQNVSVPSESFLEVDNLSVRGTMSVYELVINQIRATNGTLIVSSAGKIDSVSGSNWTFEDPTGSNLCPFAVDDLVIIQEVDVNASTIVKRIVRRVSVVTGKTITTVAASGGPVDSGTVAAGDTVVRFGNVSNAARRGSVLITSDMSNSPYTDTIAGVTSWADWTGGTKTRARMGHLSGITGTANEYGLIAGASGYTTSDAYVKFSTAGVVQNNVDSQWRDGGTLAVTVDPTNGISLQTFDTAGGVISLGDQRVLSWCETLPSTTPDGYMYVQRTTIQNEMYIEARAVSPRAGYLQLRATGEAATGNAKDSALFTLQGAQLSTTRSLAALSADDFEIDLGNGSANIGSTTLYNKQLLISDGATGDDGVATAPVFSFLDDPDTGLYRSAANTLNFATGGVNRMTINNTSLAAHQNTNNPAYIGYAQLGYVGFAGYAGFAHADRANTTDYALLQYSDGRTYINAATTKDIRFRIANADRMIMSDVGLSIGTGVVPTFILDIIGDASVRQTSTTAAIPVLTLNQADLSEEFINFVSTVGAGNAIDTAALGAYYGKVRVAVNGTFKWLALYS